MEGSRFTICGKQAAPGNCPTVCVNALYRFSKLSRSPALLKTSWTIPGSRLRITFRVASLQSGSPLRRLGSHDILDAFRRALTAFPGVLALRHCRPFAALPMGYRTRPFPCVSACYFFCLACMERRTSSCSFRTSSGFRLHRTAATRLSPRRYRAIKLSLSRAPSSSASG